MFKPIYQYKSKFTKIENDAIKSVYDNSKNALEAAMLMNPTNYFNILPGVGPVKGFLASKVYQDFLKATRSFSNSYPIPVTGLINNYVPEWFFRGPGAEREVTTDAIFSPIILSGTKKGFGLGKKDEVGSLFHGISLKSTTPVCPYDVFCNAGIAAAFGCYTQDFDNFGGYPGSPSSQVILDSKNNKFKDYSTFIFEPGKHYERGGIGFLTDEGAELFKKILNFKGAVYSVTRPDGSGHVGMIMGAYLEEVKNVRHTRWSSLPKGAKLGTEFYQSRYRGWLYTLEYNTRTGTSIDILDKIWYQNPSFIQNKNEPPRNYMDEYYTYMKKNYPQAINNPDFYYRVDNAGNERVGGKLAFRTRLLGGFFFFTETGAPEELINFAIAGTGHMNGGAWNPNGLANSYSYRFIGDWKSNKNIFEP